MDAKDIKENNYYKTPKGRIGRAYAVTKRKLEQGYVDLFFDGAGCVFVGEDFAPPSGLFKIELLTPAEKPKKI